MIALEYFFAAHANPIGLFGWMFVLESLGGDIGANLADCVNNTLSLDGRATYFLRGHAEADAHHSQDLLRVISAHVVSPSDVRAFEFMAHESIDLYSMILDSATAGPSAPAA